MNKKFDKIPVEEATEILQNVDMNLGDHEIRYQKWLWDGIHAESFIFFNEDIENMSEQDIVEEAKKSPMVKQEEEEEEEITYIKGDTYTFVNFNFTVDEDSMESLIDDLF